jgi:hypothetical protein
MPLEVVAEALADACDQCLVDVLELQGFLLARRV